MSPLILLLFTTEYHNIMMNSSCSVVYLSPLCKNFMQVFLALGSWTGHQRVKRYSITRKGKVLIHLQAWIRPESLSSSGWKILTQDKIIFFGKKQYTFRKYTFKKYTFRKYTFRKYTFGKNTFEKIPFWICTFR